MRELDRRIWTSDSLTAFVAIFVIVVAWVALFLIGWGVNLLGGFDRIKAWWWTPR